MLDILGDLLTWVQSHHDQAHVLATFSTDIVTIAGAPIALVKLVLTLKPKAGERPLPRRKSPHP